jgi:hypothetical protein
MEAPLPQVTLLSSGRLMYQGRRSGLTEWFAALGYVYDPGFHGVSSDWCGGGAGAPGRREAALLLRGQSSANRRRGAGRPGPRRRRGWGLGPPPIILPRMPDGGAHAPLLLRSQAGDSYAAGAAHAPDRALDLVAIGFSKPSHFYGSTIATRDDLLAASDAFKAHYLARAGLTDDEASSLRAPCASTPGSLFRGPIGGGAAPEGASPWRSALGLLGARLSRQRAPAGGLQLAASVGELLALDGRPGDAGGGPGGGAAAAPLPARRSSGGATAAADGAGRGAAGALAQWRTLLWREQLAVTRNPFDVAGRTLTFSWVGVLMGILYYGLPVRGGHRRWQEVARDNTAWHGEVGFTTETACWSQLPRSALCHQLARTNCPRQPHAPPPPRC